VNEKTVSARKFLPVCGGFRRQCARGLRSDQLPASIALHINARESIVPTELGPIGGALLGAEPVYYGGVPEDACPHLIEVIDLKFEPASLEAVHFMSLALNVAGRMHECAVIGSRLPAGIANDRPIGSFDDTRKSAWKARRAPPLRQNDGSAGLAPRHQHAILVFPSSLEGHGAKGSRTCLWSR